MATSLESNPGHIGGWRVQKTTTSPLLSVEFEYHLLAGCSVHRKSRIITIINFLLTEREGRTGEYWPEVVAVRTERSEVRTKTTEGQYSPVRLELARLVSSLLYEERLRLYKRWPCSTYILNRVN